jgi:hypothetical protein
MPVLKSDQPNKPLERRAFPRIPAQCPVRFRDSQAQRWLIGRLVDYSAAGLCMITPRALDIGDSIAIQIERGSKRDIPPLAGEGTVIRCSEAPGGQYQVGIKILRFTRRSG